ncbi:hypothetical protein JCM19992_04790 [Thermostilla marina]
MLVGIVFVAAAACGQEARVPTFRVVEAVPLSAWDARFAPSEAWGGADGAYSVPLSSDRILWLFGDTFTDAARRRMVNNSIALARKAQSGDRTAWTVDFHFGSDAAGRRASWIVPRDGRGFFWLLSGLRLSKRAVLAAAQIEHTQTGGPFGFRQIGQWLLVIDNPDAEVASWRVEQYAVPHFLDTKARAIVYGLSFLLHDGRLYIYGYDEDRRAKPFPDKRLIVARGDPQHVADFTAWRFFDGNGWAADFRRAAPLFGGAASEGSVTYSADRHCFEIVYTEIGLSPRILYRNAASPTGPWSEPLLLYPCPEGDDKGLFCYAGKAHPELARQADELIITYAANAWDFKRLVEDRSVYQPRFVRVRLAEDD